MTDKELFYSVLGREIDNLLSINPALSFLGTAIKNYVFNYIDSYIDFFMTGGKLETDMAAAFIEDEMSKKIESFKNKFQQEKNNEKEK